MPPLSPIPSFSSPSRSLPLISTNCNSRPPHPVAVDHQIFQVFSSRRHNLGSRHHYVRVSLQLSGSWTRTFGFQLLATHLLLRQRSLRLGFRFASVSSPTHGVFRVLVFCRDNYEVHLSSGPISTCRTLFITYSLLFSPAVTASIAGSHSLHRRQSQLPSPGANRTISSSPWVVFTSTVFFMRGAGILPSVQQKSKGQTPSSSADALSPSSLPSHLEEVRTIFIMGLPVDVKERELQNLLRWLLGFEDSHLSYKGEKPKGFALFSNAEFAVAAKDALQKMVFDSKLKSLLHIEMARKNLVVKRGTISNYDAHVPPVQPLPNPASLASPSIHVPFKSGSCDEKSAVDGVHDGTRESITKECNVDKKSSTGVLHKSRMEDDSRKKHYKVEGVIDEEKLQVLNYCLVGWCKNFIKISHLARQMHAKGLTGFSLMRAAGNAVLMIFEDSASLRSVKSDKSETLVEWFSIVEAWSDCLVLECRRVWLVCKGVPFHAWNWDTFKNIADSLGQLLAIDKSCQSPSSFDRAKIQVLAKAGARIDATLELKVGDNSFKIMVHEIEPSFKPNSWAPEEDESN
ncbi:hypothetical protein F3Y22_tig00116971pilonHSYRG00342 [Hibiscus syriacus]|uniref:Uncharacterized protein n=1 Tax=Hibiscus syriacus TaxID=106335 RepID=A0A6A2XIU7_HIBSY|nr:hypothetical protein F3Y22_tig00116971pilonHSYRG00342 [Hibiscus syriacus]